MQRVCFVLNVRPERLEEYKARHRHVWPEMIRALQESGWGNYSLFLRPDGLLIGYLETGDFSQAVAQMQGKEINTLWQREMSPFFILKDNDTADLSMVAIQEIFHLDS